MMVSDPLEGCIVWANHVGVQPFSRCSWLLLLNTMAESHPLQPFFTKHQHRTRLMTTATHGAPTGKNMANRGARSRRLILNVRRNWIRVGASSLILSKGSTLSRG